MYSLQWGHGDEAVEEGANAFDPDRYPKLQWGHGDEAVEETAALKAQTDQIQLQWGHGDEAVEEPPAPHPTRRPRKLQWGHGDEAVEEPWPFRGEFMTMTGFNGATAMKPWKRNQWFPTSGRTCQCFNGATAMKPWKRPISSSEPSILETLQWGHGDEAVEEQEIFFGLPGN